MDISCRKEDQRTKELTKSKNPNFFESGSSMNQTDQVEQAHYFEAVVYFKAAARLPAWGSRDPGNARNGARPNFGGGGEYDPT